jgi:hypothetical protein
MNYPGVAQIPCSLARANGSVSAKERLFCVADPTPRLATSAALQEVLKVNAHVPTAVALAAIAGRELPAGSDNRPTTLELGARLHTLLTAPGGARAARDTMPTMGYHRPMVRGDRRYFEVQIPVRPRSF